MNPSPPSFPWAACIALAALSSLSCQAAPHRVGAAGNVSAANGNASATSATSTYGNATATTNNKVYRITRISHGRTYTYYTKADAMGAVAIGSVNSLTIVQPIQAGQSPAEKRQRALDERLLGICDQADQSSAALLPRLQDALKAGANPNASNAQRTVLTYAADHGDLSIAKLAVAYGADINRHDGSLQTPLMYAAASNQFEVVRYLVDKGARVNTEGEGNETALSLAVEAGNVDIVTFLLSRGASCNTATRSNITPLSTAVTKRDDAMVDVLLPHVTKANLNMRDFLGNTVLGYAIMPNQRDITLKLLKAGADPNIKFSGKYLLEWAVSYEDVPFARALIAAGAKPTLCSPPGTLEALALTDDMRQFVRSILAK